MNSEAQIPIQLFALPGSLVISEDALGLAKAFLDAIQSTHPNRDWIVAFEWADDRRFRRIGSNDWQELGAGLDIGAYDKSLIPPSAIWSESEIQFVVKMRQELYKELKERTIRVKEGSEGELALR